MVWPGFRAILGGGYMLGVMMRRFCTPSGGSVAGQVQVRMHVVLDTWRSTDVRQIDVPPVAPHRPPHMPPICP